MALPNPSVDFLPPVRLPLEIGLLWRQFPFNEVIRMEHSSNRTGALKRGGKGLPWWSSGLRFRLPMQGVQVCSLVRELRSHMPHGQKNKTENRSNSVTNSIKTSKNNKKKILKKKKRRKRHHEYGAQRKGHVRTQREGGHLQAGKTGLTRAILTAP